MAPGSRCMSGNTCGFNMSWTYNWVFMVPWINTRGDHVLREITSHNITPAVGATTCFHSTEVQFPLAWYHYKRRRRWVGVRGITRNGCRYPKCPSAKCLRMVRDDTGAPNEDATCTW
ncbi:UNVERIFIED_CONTAM: hypothetical protein NCL1_10902 [Trichonephila clavipes]